MHIYKITLKLYSITNVYTLYLQLECIGLRTELNIGMVIASLSAILFG